VEHQKVSYQMVAFAEFALPFLRVLAIMLSPPNDTHWTN
jgi:hypothetical protein